MDFKVDTFKIDELVEKLDENKRKIINKASGLSQKISQSQWSDAVYDKTAHDLNAHFISMNAILSHIDDLKNALKDIKEILDKQYFTYAK